MAQFLVGESDLQVNEPAWRSKITIDHGFMTERYGRKKALCHVSIPPPAHINHAWSDGAMVAPEVARPLRTSS